MTNVYANKRTIVHRGDGLVHTCPVPDVCKTPTPGGPVPVPYVNTATSRDLASGTKRVAIAGNPVAIASSNLRTSVGDEPGTAGGGIISGKIKGKLTWGSSSPNVRIEGKGVVRHMDSAQHNGNQSNTFTLTGGTVVYPVVDDNALCANCGKPMNAHNPDYRLPESNESRDAVTQFGTDLQNNPTTGNKAGMIGALVSNCPGPPPHKDTLLAVAGAPTGKVAFKGWAGVAGAGKSATNFTPGSPVTVQTVRGPAQITKPPAGTHPPLQCAAQKLIQTALAKGCKPASMTEAWMVKQDGGDTTHSVASCPTCQDNIARMLCPDEPA